MKEETYRCPHCQQTIGFDEDGIYGLEYEPHATNQTRGLGSLVVEHSGDLRALQYQNGHDPDKTPALSPLPGAKAPSKHAEKPQRREVSHQEDAAAVVVDEQMQEVLDKDLSRRGVSKAAPKPRAKHSTKTKTKTTN